MLCPFQGKNVTIQYVAYFLESRKEACIVKLHFQYIKYITKLQQGTLWYFLVILQLMVFMVGIVLVEDISYFIFIFGFKIFKINKYALITNL